MAERIVAIPTIYEGPVLCTYLEPGDNPQACQRAGTKWLFVTYSAAVGTMIYTVGRSQVGPLCEEHAKIENARIAEQRIPFETQ